MTDQRAAPFPLFRLLVLTGAIFASVTSEFLPTGLLPDIGSDLRVSESQVGLLVTVFAGVVVVTTAPLAALTRRVPRKGLVIATLTVFAVANLAAAFAPGYGWLMAVRVLAALAHGLFWTVVGPYSARMVPRHQLSRAVAVTGAGASMAFVLGVPLGTALGHALGWRLAFALLGFVVLGFVVLVATLLPPVAHLIVPATGEILVPVRRDHTIPVIVIVAVTVAFVVIGQNVFYTYIAPWSIQVGSLDPGGVPGLLFAGGVAGAGGLAIAGWLGDRFPRGSVVAMIAGMLVSVLGLGLFAPGAPVGVLIGTIAWSLAWGGIPAMMQSRMLHGTSQRLRDMGSAWVTISFNVSIGGGALAGGLLLDHVDIQALPFAAAILLAGGVVFVIATDRFRIARHPG
jgi:predicted MFS family arabinose efflux permease